jgi:hypothetical protein
MINLRSASNKEEVKMGKYLFIVTVLGIYIYLYMDLPKDMQAATQYEIVQLHNPLIPLPANAANMQESNAAVQDKARVILVSAPVRETPRGR